MMTGVWAAACRQVPSDWLERRAVREPRIPSRAKQQQQPAARTAAARAEEIIAIFPSRKPASSDAGPTIVERLFGILSLREMGERLILHWETDL